MRTMPAPLQSNADKAADGSTPKRAAATGSLVGDDGAYQRKQQRTESPRDRGERSYPFTPGRFHGLLNSLSKVLFNFPSRYLSAIGLVPVFSLGWSLPPALGCVPKQPDSRTEEHRRSPPAPNGPGTRCGQPRSRGLRT